MPLVTRLHSNGQLLVANSLNEISISTHRVATDFLYASSFDEVSSLSGIASRRWANGTHSVSGEFDEYTLSNPSEALILAHFNSNLTNDSILSGKPAISVAQGTASYAAGKFGNGISFNGSGNFVASTDITNWDIQNNANWTWEWFLTPTTFGGVLFSTYLASDRSFSVEVGANTVVIGNRLPTTYTYTYTFTSNFSTSTPNHICLMRKAGVMYCFKDGVPASFTTTGSIVPHSNTFLIGSYQFGGSLTDFVGACVIDELRIVANNSIYDTAGFYPPSVEYTQ